MEGTGPRELGFYQADLGAVEVEFESTGPLVSMATCHLHPEPAFSGSLLRAKGL